MTNCSNHSFFLSFFHSAFFCLFVCSFVRLFASSFLPSTTSFFLSFLPSLSPSFSLPFVPYLLTYLLTYFSPSLTSFLPSFLPSILSSILSSFLFISTPSKNYLHVSTTFSLTESPPRKQSNLPTSSLPLPISSLPPLYLSCATALHPPVYLYLLFSLCLYLVSQALSLAHSITRWITPSLSLPFYRTLVSLSMRTKVLKPSSSDVNWITPVQDRIIVTKAFFAQCHFATKTDGSESKSVNGES